MGVQEVWKHGSVSWRSVRSDVPLPGLQFHGSFFKNDVAVPHLPEAVSRVMPWVWCSQALTK